MVNKTQAMTAGHCVYSSKHGGMATSITVIPARSGDSKPYGTHAVKSMYVEVNLQIQTQIGVFLLLKQILVLLQDIMAYVYLPAI